VEEAADRGAKASLVQERYPVYYVRIRIGDEETREPRWSVNRRPGKGDPPETASDSEGVRRLREKANSLRKDLVTREEASKQIDQRVKELLQ